MNVACENHKKLTTSDLLSAAVRTFLRLLLAAPRTTHALIRVAALLYEYLALFVHVHRLQMPLQLVDRNLRLSEELRVADVIDSIETQQQTHLIRRDGELMPLRLVCGGKERNIMYPCRGFLHG